MPEITANIEYSDMIDALAGQQEQNTPFENMMKLFVAAAALGIKNKSKLSLKKNRGKSVADRIWSRNENLEQFIFATAFYETKDQQVFNDFDKCYKIFEEYVNGGLEELKEIYLEDHDAESLFEKLIEEMAHQTFDNLPQ